MDLLRSLHLTENNSGASTGSAWWSDNKDHTIISHNPTTAEPIANVP